MSRRVVHAGAVRPDQPRRWFYYQDSADRAIVERPAAALHLRPRRNDEQLWAVVEDLP